MKKRLCLSAGFIVMVLLVFSQCRNNRRDIEADLEAGFLR